MSSYQVIIIIPIFEVETLFKVKISSIFKIAKFLRVMVAAMFCDW